MEVRWLLSGKSLPVEQRTRFARSWLVSRHFDFQVARSRIFRDFLRSHFLPDSTPSASCAAVLSGLYQNFVHYQNLTLRTPLPPVFSDGLSDRFTIGIPLTGFPAV
jgi:hypothetical protein